MNVIMFVSVILLMLAVLTYARIDSYRNFSGMQSEFVRYMETLERKYINQTANNWYDSTVANKKSSGSSDANPSASPLPPQSPQPPQTPTSTSMPDVGKLPTNPNAPPKEDKKNKKNTASPRLNVKPLLDLNAKNANDQAYAKTYQWAKNLMQVLYSKQLFFKKMMDERPTFLDEILESLPKAVELLPEDKRPKKASDLANLTIGNDLDNVYYHILKGCPSIEEEKPVVIAPTVEQSQSQEEVDENESDNAQEAKEYTSDKGYDSLLNFITLNNSTKIRVFLASRELLMAIFQQPELVENIITTRYALYRSIKGGMSPADATNQFKAMFPQMGEAETNMLDFEVNSTNPMPYN